jgi:hypothetical protein
MWRATLRITLLSSTIRQVFMEWTLSIGSFELQI